MLSVFAGRQCSQCLKVDIVLSVCRLALFSVFESWQCSHCLKVGSVLSVCRLAVF